MASFNIGKDTPDTLPPTNQEQNSPGNNTPGRKSHLGRILVVGGVAVAVALSACMFSKNGDNTKPASDTDSEPAITESYDNEQNYVNDEQTEPVITQPETEPTSSNGLTVDALVDELYPNQSLDEALRTDPTEVGEEIAHWLATDGGYNKDAHPLNGNNASAVFDTGTIRVETSSNGFTISIGLYGNPTLYEYDTQTIPTATEAEQIALDNLM